MVFTARRSTVVAGAVAIAAMATLTGCKSTAASSSAAVDQNGLSSAKQYVAPFLEQPTKLALPALSKQPPKGKTLISLVNPVPAAVTKNAATKAAVEALGWTFTGITVQGTAEGPRQALAAAIAQKPDYIAYSGYSNDQMGPELKVAQDAGIPVIADGLTTDTTASQIANSINANVQVMQAGKVLAGYVTQESAGKANIALFNLSVYPTLNIFTKSFTDNLKTFCPSCTLKTVDNDATDIGTKLPQRVVSTLQAGPDINWVLFTLGDMANGVPAALKGAGLSKQVKLGGQTPSATNLADLKNGTENVWVGISLTVQGWAVADVAARQSVGDDLSIEPKALVPMQLITNDNISQTSLAPDGNFIGLTNYIDLYKQIWQLSTDN